MLKLDLVAGGLISALLFASPLSNTPALRHLLAFILLLLLPIYLARRQISWRELLPFGPWVFIVYLSALWSPASHTTLVDATWSVLAPVACFLTARHLASRYAAHTLHLPLSAFFVALLLITIGGAVQHLAWPLSLPDWLLRAYPARGIASTFAVLGAVIGLWLFFSDGCRTAASRRLHRLMGGCLLTTALALGSLGYNRMFWPTLAIAALPWCLFFTGTPLRRLLLLTGTILIVVVGFLYATVIARPGMNAIQAPLGVIAKGAEQDPRWAIWREWTKVIAERPLLGYGYGTRILPQIGKAHVSPDMELTDSHGVTHAHNVFINVIIQTGLIGLACFLITLGAVARTAWAGLAHEPVARSAAIATLSLLMSAISKSLTDDFFFGPPGIVMWILLGLLLANATDTARTPARTD